ncbi:MAG: signal recognition particle receptor subunit alpha, partial [Promethearchaeota archaeon]
MLEQLKNAFSSFIKKSLSDEKIDDTLYELKLLLISNDVAAETADELCNNIKHSLRGEQIGRLSSKRKYLFEVLKNVI